ncbi:MAG: hypothetical protein WCG75_03035 [Armatimonadota bacterium]
MRYSTIMALVFGICVVGCGSKSVTRHYRLEQTDPKAKTPMFELFLKNDKMFEVTADKQKMFDGTWTEAKDELILSPTKAATNSHFHALNDKLVRFEDGKDYSDETWVVVKDQ